MSYSASGIKIYLAGKVSKNGWRTWHVGGLRDAYNQTDYTDDEPWPILEDAIGPGLHYVGPYFVSCDHGCAHEGKHAFTNGGCLVDFPVADPAAGHGIPGDYIQGGLRRNVVGHCLDAIAYSDVVIAVVEPDAHGTLVEIGYAVALKKKIILVNPAGTDYDDDSACGPDAWFPFAIAGIEECVTVDCAIKSLGQQNKAYREKSLIESPIEHLFYDAMRRFPELDPFVPQVKVNGGAYRVDFGDPDRRIGIELDGYEWHSSKDQFIKDRQRQRDLEGLGWRLLRFAGSEVHADANKCALQTINWLSSVA